MTADLATLRALKERCEAAPGPDRELDHDLIVHFAGAGNLMAMLRHYPLTSSIDAALALVDRMLPNAIWTIQADYCAIRVLTDTDVAEFKHGFCGGGGKLTPLAVLTAMFAALISRAEEARQS